MEVFSSSLALCAGNSPVTGEFPSQRAVTLNFDVFFDLRLNKRLSKQSRCRWFGTASQSLWRHCNGHTLYKCILYSVIINTQTNQNQTEVRTHASGLGNHCWLAHEFRKLKKNKHCSKIEPHRKSESHNFKKKFRWNGYRRLSITDVSC